MLRLDLYKGVEINDKYSNVFADTTVLEEFLNLESHGKTTVNVSYVYATNKGTLVFPFQFTTANDIYAFNYMKVTDIDDIDQTTVNFIRYCFVKSIRIINEMVYLDYEEDIWHNYAFKIKGCNASYLSRSRVLKDYENMGINYYNLPVEYDGNNALDNTPLTTTPNVYFVIVQFQIYSLTTQGATYERKCFLAMLGDKNDNRQFSTFSSALEIIKKAEYYKQTKCFYYTGGGGVAYYYTCPIYYIIPAFTGWINNVDNLFNGTQLGYFGKGDEDDIYPVYQPVYANAKTYTGTFSFENNFKNRLIGIYGNLIQCVNNGTDITVRLNLELNTFDLNFQLLVENNLIDITKNVKVDLPFGYNEGETLTGQRINNTIGGLYDIVKILG